MSNKDIIAEGARHFREHTSYRNPYKVGTDAFNDFERGWVQALKRANLPCSPTYLRPWPRNPEG